MTATGFKRALRYFVRQAGLYVLCTIGGSFAMALYMWIVNGNSGGIFEVLKMVPFVDLWMTGIELFAIGVSSYHYCYEIPVSFGCIRKNAFWGTFAMDLFVIAGGMLFYFLSSVWFSMDTKDIKAKGIEAVIILSLFLLLEGFAKAIGITTMKWGKAAYVIMVAGIIFISISFGVFISLSGISGMIAMLAGWLGMDVMRFWHWTLLAAAAAASIAANAVSWHFLKRFEVKA